MPVVSFLIVLLNNEGAATQKIRLSLLHDDSCDGPGVVSGTALQQAILDHIHRSDAVIEVYYDHTFVRLQNLKGPFGTRLRCIVVENTPPLTHPPLQLVGRYFDYNGTKSIRGHVIHVDERPSHHCSSTGSTVWDGALLLTNYLEHSCSSLVQGKNILEFGSGTGLVGIAAAHLGAKRVIMTDLPYALPLMQANVQKNIVTSTEVECRKCDWFNPPDFSGNDWLADVVLLADCVWVQELVPPLIATLEKFMIQHSPIVLVSYQQRGKTAHELFWQGMHQLFSIILEVDIASCGLSKPDVLHIYQCQKERKR